MRVGLGFTTDYEVAFIRARLLKSALEACDDELFGSVRDQLFGPAFLPIKHFGLQLPASVLPPRQSALLAGKPVEFLFTADEARAAIAVAEFLPPPRKVERPDS